MATFNINGINARLENLLEYLARDRPDVVCLQELKATDVQFPAAAIEAAGYYALWSGQRLWNGVAILSRGTQPVETRRQLPGMEDDDQARYLEAAVQGVLVAAVYLPNGNPIKSAKFTYKLKWFEALIAHAQTLFDAGHPVALIGDFNVVPTDDDIYNPKSWVRDALLQPQSRECFRRLLAQGWLDERIYTFWDYFREHWKRDAGLRIDHLLLSRELAPTLRDANVSRWVRDRPHVSDHAPTWIELELPTANARSASRRPRKPLSSVPAPPTDSRRTRAGKNPRQLEPPRSDLADRVRNEPPRAGQEVGALQRRPAGEGAQPRALCAVKRTRCSLSG